jgi:putative flippase GtrA
MQALRFCVVGAVGFGTNLGIYMTLVSHGMVPALAAGVGFAVAVTTNYLLHRLWTFRNERGGFSSQGIRFLLVSLASLGVNVGMLSLLLAAALGKLPAQALAICIAMPANFLGNKFWSFRALEVQRSDWP